VDSECADGFARRPAGIGADSPFGLELPGAVNLDRVAAIIRQVAVGSFHQARQIKKSSQPGGVLAVCGRPHLMIDDILPTGFSG
jgi:hypothetical protein